MANEKRVIAFDTGIYNMGCAVMIIRNDTYEIEKLDWRPLADRGKYISRCDLCKKVIEYVNDILGEGDKRLIPNVVYVEQSYIRGGKGNTRTTNIEVCLMTIFTMMFPNAIVRSVRSSAIGKNGKKRTERIGFAIVEVSEKWKDYLLELKFPASKKRHQHVCDAIAMIVDKEKINTFQ